MIEANKGGKLRSKVFDVSAGMRVPKYLMWFWAHLKWKFFLRRDRRVAGILMFRASDFCRFILKLEREE